jgi:site-specific DNA-methyltransferase (adenine-specific)
MERIKGPMLIYGECLGELRKLESNSIDSLVTDPPAGISFMGKNWDKDKGGRYEWIAWMRTVMQECMRVLKPGAHGLVWALPRTSHWTATALEDAGFEVRDVITHLFGSGFPKSLDISKAIDKAAGVERDIVGQMRTHNIRGNALMDKKGQEQVNITAPASPAAKRWAGYGTALKPASEHWILVRKPLSEKTVALNVLKWGCGGMNIDGSRIKGKLEGDPNRFSKAYSQGQGHEGWKRTCHDNYVPPVVRNEGRFPANLVLSHNEECGEECTEGCAVASLDAQSIANGMHSAGHARTSGSAKQTDPNSLFLKDSGSPNNGVRMGDTGGASRFFYCAKASKSDRNEGNTHPCVKSTKLMQYLITLITPPAGIVLDPFTGSGSTGVAALKAGFRFLGIEQEQDYVKIAQARCSKATITQNADNKNRSKRD